MKKKKWIATVLCVIAIVMTTVFGVYFTEIAKASADIYNNAYAFYQYVEEWDDKCEFADMNFYYVTRAKKASSINVLRYITVGWHITVNEKFCIDVRRDISASEGAVYLTNVDDVSREEGSKIYQYNLYCISYESISKLMYNKYGQEWVDETNNESSIIMRFDAIMSYKPKGKDVPAGYITGEDGKGEVTFENRDKCYYMIEGTKEYENFCKLFNKSFDGFYGIEQPLKNYTLTLNYKATKSDTNVNIDMNNESFFINLEGGENKYQIYDSETNKPFTQQMRRFSYMPSENKKLSVKSVTDYFGLDRPGYHIDLKTEWEKVESPGSYVSSGESYLASALDVTSATKDVTLTLVANWIPNIYTIRYDSNGGEGNISDTVLTYNKSGKLSKNVFNKAGYEIDSDEAWIDEDGKTYALGEEVSNLTEINGDVITLYANWKPKTILVITDKQGGIGGTDFFYQKYGIGNFSNAGCMNGVKVITVPSLVGHTFSGYYTSTNGKGDKIVVGSSIAETDASGTITNTYFLQDTTIYAYWTPNTYKITLDNQGADIISGTEVYYEKYKSGNYRNEKCVDAIANIIVPQKTGYTFGGYYTEKNGHGDAYVSTGGKITSESSSFTQDTTLYAYWIPNIYEITLDMQDGKDGTTYFFEKYGVGFYSDRECENEISVITVPSKRGNSFEGYWTISRGAGEEIISYGGSETTTPIGLANTYFTSNITLYASWKAEEYIITFDKQDGTDGTSSATVIYGDTYPIASAPKRGTYVFKGYYTQTNGGGTLIYDMYMNTSQKYTLTTNQILYAYWVDEMAPTINLLVDYNTWTNQEVTLMANASDYGSGLSSVFIYLLNDDGSLSSSPVVSATNLNGATSKQLTFVNTTEGVIRYKAIATDMHGLISECINVVYYDKTAPTGTLIEGGKNGDIFELEFDITDINTGN